MSNAYVKNDKFEMICQMSNLRVKKYVEFMLKQTHKDITVADGFVFAKGTFPVLLVAHMDTVHQLLPDKIEYDEVKDRLSCKEGIGGDDRCGIYMILEVIKRYNCSVLFCEDEEVGCIGARKFIETDLAKELEFNYAIEFDRKGSNDAVFYDCDNEEFEEFITKEFYKTAYGSVSDISVVAPFLKCAAVNLSCGYYNAHTLSEYVVLHEMEKSIEEACKILERTTENDKFEYIEAVRNFGYYGGGYYGGSYYGNSYYDGYYYGAYSRGSSYKGNSSSNYNKSSYAWYDDDDDAFTNYYIIEFANEKGKTEWFDTYAVSEAEAIGRFLMWHPDLCYGDVIDVLVDNGYTGK